MRFHFTAFATALWLAVPVTGAAQSMSPSTPKMSQEAAAAEEKPPESADPAPAPAEGPRWHDACRMDPSEWRGGRVPDTPVYSRAPDGACFCSVLATRATRAGRRHTFGAWTLGTIAASLLIVGPVIGNEPHGSVWQRERGTLISVSGVALAPLAYYFFMRADRDGSVAARATESQGEGDLDSDFATYRACAAAKADWVASREASVAFSAIALERLEKAAEESKQSAENAQKSADESRENAEAANKSAEQAQESADSAEQTNETRGGRHAAPAAQGDEEETDKPAKKPPVRP